MNDVTNAVPDLERLKREHRALAILRMLERQPSYRSNGEVLSSYLATIGLTVMRAELVYDLDHLERAGLVTSVDIATIAVIELTEAGRETANGVTVMDGVLRPSPDCPY